MSVNEKDAVLVKLFNLTTEQAKELMHLLLEEGSVESLKAAYYVLDVMTLKKEWGIDL